MSTSPPLAVGALGGAALSSSPAGGGNLMPAPLVGSAPSTPSTPTPFTTNGADDSGNAVTGGSDAARLAQKSQLAFTLRKGTRAGTLPTPPAASAAVPATPTAPPLTPAAAPAPPPYPALHLAPLNDTFVPKQIFLSPPGSRVKIGRQTNAKTIPNGTNGYFDSKVLSRMHAEVWSENDKVYIKDVKSSNGTFINGERLSQEAAESETFELHSEDVVEFGIDIVSDDNKTIVHHKVAAKVFIVMNAEDALASSREFSNWYRASSESAHQRRNNKVTGTNGLSFDHVINRLQSELQKSRDTGTDLGSLSSTLNQVHDTLSGGAPPALPPFPHPTRAPSYVPTNGAPKDAHASSIALLQSQLNETQLSLAGHVGKIQDLEGRLAEHAAIKMEVGALREQMEHGRRDIFTLMRARDAEREGGADGRESPIAALLNAQEADDDIEDNSRSINSIDTIRDKPTISARPNGVHRSVDLDSTTGAALQEQNERLSNRLEKLSSELDEAIKLGQALRTQHAEATETIRTLESRITGLEKAVEVNVAEAEGRIRVESEERWHGWRESFEASAKKDRLDWEAEREKLMQVVREWEAGRDSSSSGNESEESERDWTSEVKQSAGDVGLAGLANEGKSKLRKRKKSSRGRGLSKVTADGLLRSTGSPTDSSNSMESSRWRGSKPRSNRGASTVVGSNLINVPYTSVGAVVVVGLAAAWALSVKLKE